MVGDDSRARPTSHQWEPALRVLVVEDDLGVRRAWVDAFERAGHTVVDAESAVEALTRLSEFEPDVIVADLVMPEMDGIELVEEVRRDPVLSHIPLVLVTALAEGVSDWRAAQIARKSGVAAMIAKPLKPGSLVDQVIRIAAASRRASAPASPADPVERGGTGPPGLGPLEPT